MQISANSVSIEVDDQGSPNGEPLLMIMGLGMQLIAWPQDLVQMLISRGYRVIRLDNRDAGLSQGFDAQGVPNLALAAAKYTLHLPVRGPYSLADMAADSLGVLDALGVARAHVVGASMGGMIAQHMAFTQPQRVKSLTLMMTSTGARRLPQASLKVRGALLERRPAADDAEATVARLERVFTLIGSPAFRPEPQAFHERLKASVARSYRPAGVARQLIAVAADGDRSSRVARIAAPTHIIHGQADPLVPVAAAHDLHARIAGSTLDLVDGMGHDLPALLWPRFAQGIAENAARA